MNRWTILLLTGLMWFTIGLFLMMKGLKLCVFGAHELGWLMSIAGSSHQAALLLIALGLVVGYCKGRYVLIKTVKRVTERLLSLTLPLRLSQVYSKGYYILLASMMGLGILFKFLPLPPAYLGFIDTAIGSALINGALIYFRFSYSIKKKFLV